jgi:hypothetical protein
MCLVTLKRFTHQDFGLEELPHFEDVGGVIEKYFEKL